jgi:RimJ/RimL family protein N-acetyltransferase
MSGQGDIPTIETARLRLRAYVPADFTACAALWADPLVTRYITGKPLTGEEVWARLLRHAGHWQWFGFGFWALEEKSSGLFIGELGFVDYKREIKPSITGTPELGYLLAAGVHGRGYATEALHAAVAWGDERFERARTVCIVNPENAASLRVAEKCGYKEFSKSKYNGRPIVMLERG